MKKTALILLSFSIIVILFFIVKRERVNNENDNVQWNSPNESMTLDFIVGKSGHLYFEAQMNGTTGLFLFDTGAEICFINEKYITGEDLKLQSYTISDAKEIKQTKNLYKVRSFELGAIEIKDLEVYPADSLTWKDPKGIFYNQDSVIGVIGNNIISKFIWDFDMVNKRVTVSNSKSYCDSIPDSSAFKLISIRNHKEILARINGKLKRFTLDFGSGKPISLCDSIPNKKKSVGKESYSSWGKSALNHLVPKEVTESKFDFVDVKFGAYEFKEIQCYENDSSALFGIPFVWSFKRVVIDYMNNKAYFISLIEDGGDFGVMNFNRQFVYNTDGVTTYKGKPKGLTFIMGSSTVKDSVTSSVKLRYVCYGKVMFYRNSSKLDSIFCSDSIKLPDGKMKYGPITVKIDSIIQSRNIK